LKWQARRWKAGGILLANAVAAGIDPKDIDCDVNPQGKPDGAVSGKRKSSYAYFLPLVAQHFNYTNEHKTVTHRVMLLTCFTAISGYLNDGRTVSSLEHYFRPIKKEAEALRNGTSKGTAASTSWINSKPLAIDSMFLSVEFPSVSPFVAPPSPSSTTHS
jgi:hypothetical protein